MFVTRPKTFTDKAGATRTFVLLKESYRQEGKVKTRTLANLSGYSPSQVEAIRQAFQGKAPAPAPPPGADPAALPLRQGPSVGAVMLLHTLADRLGVRKALGTSREGRLALWLVLARLLDQGSRLSAVRLARTHAVGPVLGITESFTEDHLYRALAWAAERQDAVENTLLRHRTGGKPSALYLYDVTSSYLEGDHNAFGAFGYSWRCWPPGRRTALSGTRFRR